MGISTGSTSREAAPRPTPGVIRGLIWSVVVMSGFVGWSGEAVAADTNAAPAPSETPIPVVADAAAAQAAVAKAKASGQALVVDITRGHEGKLIRAKTATPLAPGRYRLHAVVAPAAADQTIYNQMLGEWVALRLVVGGNDDAPLPSGWPVKSPYGALLQAAGEFQAAPYPKPWVPEHGEGKFGSLSFDFVMDKSGPMPVAVDWFVRDLSVNHEIRPAPAPQLTTRQAVLDKLSPPEAAGGAKQPARLAPRPLSGEGLPPYRMMLAGLVLERLSPVVNVRFDGRECFAYFTPIATLAGFDLVRPGKVEIDCARPVQSVTVRPMSLGIRAEVAGNKISFPLDAPASLSVEINGDLDNPLFLFADPPEQDAPKPGTPGVTFFAAGKIHEPEKDRSVIVKSGETVYIERGAVVRGRILVNEAKNVKILGRGILDGGVFGPGQMRTLEIKNSEDVLVEGVTIIDSKHWALPIMRSDRVTVRRAKMISDNKHDDGVVVVGSRDVTIENCFIRTMDDCVAIKSGVTYFTQTDCQRDVENVTIRNCVLWSNGTGSGLQIATHNWLPDWVRGGRWADRPKDFEPQPSNIRGVRFTGNDIIHGAETGASIAIHNGDQSTVSDITCEDVRVETAAGPPVDIRIIQSPYNPSPERGHVRNVTFRNIRVEGKEIPPSAVAGFDDKHRVEGVVFENVQAGGRKWAKPEDGPLKTEFATGVEFR